jgi:hypothetical protein
MKHTILIAAAFVAGTFIASAQITIPSDGSDGALNITEDTVIDLSQAVTGTWDQNNTANAGKGVYDPEKWAVVFKYSSVNIEGHTPVGGGLQGRTVRFKNHPSNAPVVWLVQGNVTISGILSVAGGNAAGDLVSRLVPSEGGPGGFRGGAMGPLGVASGYGPSESALYAAHYGNPQIIPLIGGSGTSGGHHPTGNYTSGAYGSAGGGGAILIAASGNIDVSGRINADGGTAPGYTGNRRGSGGAIRLIAESITGTTAISAGVTANLTAFPGGRIRIEGALSPSLGTSPETIGVIPSDPPIIWPAENAPKARIISVDAETAPADPTSPVLANADVAIQKNGSVDILIETRDFPVEGVVQLNVIPKFGNRTRLTATRISGDINVATWRVTTTLPQGFVTLQARATQP